MHNLHFFSIFNGSVPRYGGDISSCSWIQYVQGGTKTYAFSYDPLSLLSGADQYGGSSLENRFTERGISYDRNGNITAITRHNNSASGTAKTFSYSGNRRVSNSYDANGNVTYDSESGVIASYNLINLPASLISSDYNIYYDYLADGTKLRTQQEELWTGYTYAGPFRYNDNDGSLSLESVAFGEGRFVRTGTGARDFDARYFVKDHLGSVRVVAEADGTALERDDYLPYGERANDPALTRNGNNFLYGGKELQDRDDIDWYDSGARFQTTFGIFTSIDPEAEKYYPISPYVYCTGNPINHIDPNGRDWYEYTDKNGNSQTMWRKSQDKTYEDNSGNTWNNIGENYISINGDYATLFTQHKNDKGELYLSSSSYNLANEKSAKTLTSSLGDILSKGSAVTCGFGGYVERCNATFRLTNSEGTFDFKFYGNGWKGNQWITPTSISRIGKGIGNFGKILGGLGTFASVYQFTQATTLEGKLEYGLDSFMGGIGFVPVVGTSISLYWSFGGKELHYMYVNKVLIPQIEMGINPGLPAYQPFK